MHDSDDKEYVFLQYGFSFEYEYDNAIFRQNKVTKTQLTTCIGI